MTASEHEGSPSEHDFAKRYVEDPGPLRHAGRGLGQRDPGSPRHHRDQRKKCDHAPHYTWSTSKITRRGSDDGPAAGVGSRGGAAPGGPPPPPPPGGGRPPAPRDPPPPPPARGPAAPPPPPHP